jgi:hypothetical protein
MRTTSAIAFSIAAMMALPAAAEPARPERVVIEVSSVEVTVPGRLGVTVRLEDADGRPLTVHRNHPGVAVTLDRVPLPVELTSSHGGTRLEGSLLFNRSGFHLVGATVETFGRHNAVVSSSLVEIAAVAPLDFGVVRAAETVCRPLPDGGLAFEGTVERGTLPRGLSLWPRSQAAVVTADADRSFEDGLSRWGVCLAADESVERHDGAFRAGVVPLLAAGPADRSERRLYDVSYRLEPRLVTPRRILAGVGVLAAIVVILTVVLSWRQRRVGFDAGTILVWSPLESTPYRGRRATDWNFLDLSNRGRRTGAVDVGALLAATGLGVGALCVRPTEQGLVEFMVPRDEEIRGVTPNRSMVAAQHRLAVPYGSTVTFRGVAVSLLVGVEPADACRGADDLHGVQQL